MLTLVVTLGAIGLMLLGAEAAIRVRQTLRYGTASTVDEYYRLDPKLDLRVPIAGMAKGHISINSLGFRGPEISVPKPVGTTRVAYLGSSTTWCAEVSGNEYTWPHLTTGALGRAFPDRRFDYVNGGVPGYTVASSLKNLELRIAPLDPDVIVIYEGLNDLSGELRDVAARQGVIAEAKMHEMSWLSRYSVLWNLAEKNLRVLASQREARRNQGRVRVDPEAIGEGYRKELTHLVRVAQAHAKIVAVATLATRVRSGQDPDQQARALGSALFFMPFITADGLIEAYARYNRVVREVAADTGAILIAGEDSIPDDAAHFADSVHFTDAGSQAMADRVSRALITRLKSSNDWHSEAVR
jgi:lysophospholipase L1-like esterase